MKNYGGFFEPEKKEKRIQELETEMNDSYFWDDQRRSQMIISELNDLKETLKEANSLKQELENNLETLSLLKVQMDEEVFELISSETNSLEERLNQLEEQQYLNGLNDKNDAILEIHSGAGGTEACDWANMLYRMYLRYLEKHQYQVEVLEEQPGEEVGIKSVMMIIHGYHAYGYLKEEKGVHRLVRLSPFDSNNRRHTSFASVDVTPKFDQDINIELKESDLRIDVYRSSGNGGQGVNTTDSAVRITHLPSKIVVTCQNERSQIQNKEKAMQILKAKLYQIELEKQKEELNGMKDHKEINFGSQIRSYVMHPYSLVKDHRTNFETSNVSKVLDGDLDAFISASLKRGV